jgi:hypothetical protein
MDSYGRKETSGELLWNFGFDKRWEIYWLAELEASQEEFCFVLLFGAKFLGFILQLYVLENRLQKRIYIETLTELVIAGRCGELDNIQRESPYGALAQRIDPGDVGTPFVNRSQDLRDLLITVVPELDCRSRHCRSTCFTGKYHQRLRKDVWKLRRRGEMRGWEFASMYVLQ